MTAQQAKLKQLKRVQVLKSKTHQKADVMSQRREKASMDEQRVNAANARHQQARAERAQREAQAEV